MLTTNPYNQFRQAHGIQEILEKASIFWIVKNNFL